VGQPGFDRLSLSGGFVRRTSGALALNGSLYATPPARSH